uniref:Uncharacterized protein n=1 Tax=Timema poppense TaxID=170557 RepID=A0A7R9D4W5_TIMPO|nr:unnamed protein product [Timema poppensis]
MRKATNLGGHKTSTSINLEFDIFDELNILSLREVKKVVTIHIGGNDFCLDMCYQDEDQVPENHRNNLQRSLDYLQDNLPRTLVNLVTTTNLNIIQKFKGTSDICKAVHLVECPCLFGLPHAHKFQKFREIMHRCQEVENEVAHKSRFLCNVCRAGSTCGKPTLLLEQWDLQLLRHPHFTSSRQESDTVMSKMSSPTLEPSTSADKRRPKRPAGRPKTKKPGTSGEDWECGVYGINSGRYDMKEDFSVVIQPLTEEVIFPEKVTASGRRITDFDCLSKDCFHFSQKCQARDPNLESSCGPYFAPESYLLLLMTLAMDSGQLKYASMAYIYLKAVVTWEEGGSGVMSPGDTNSELHGDNEDSTSGVPDCGTPTTDISGQPAAGELPAKKKAKKVVDQSSKIPMKKFLK